MGDCQNYGPFLGPYYNTGPNTGPNLRDPKRDHTFDNPLYVNETCSLEVVSVVQGLACSTTTLPGSLQAARIPTLVGLATF